MPLPLSLRPSSSGRENAEPLSKVIEQIFAERGHLRDITAEPLKAEIEVEDGEESVSDSSGEDEHKLAQDADSRTREVQAARMEMLQLVGQANNDALTALDFIALLQSRDAPRQAETSMSPALKSMTPAGTLGYDKTDASKQSKADIERDQRMALGINFESLHSTADKILGSATRLENEIQKETKYWEQILSVSEKGWNLCRMPGQNHTVGVRFGFSEAAPQFQARSLAALRSDENGDLYMEREASNDAKSIRIRIFQGDDMIETSSLPLLEDDQDSGLDTLVHQARDSLYDEELFFELTREARSLFSDGIRVINGVISIPFDTRPSDPATPTSTSNQKRLVVDLVSRTRTSPKGSLTADSIALAFRILLTHAHRQKYRKRSEPPPPMTLEKTPPQTLNLLQPFLNHVTHSARTSELNSAFSNLAKTMRSAGLECAFSMQQDLGGKLSTLSANTVSDNKQSTMTERIVSLLSGPLPATFSASLSSSTDLYLSVTVTTNLAAPTYGTKYILSTSSQSQDSRDLTFSDATQLTQHIDTLYRESIVSYIAENVSGWTVDKYDPGRGSSELRSTKERSAKRLVVYVSKGRLAVATREAGAGGSSESERKKGPVVVGAWDTESRPGQETLLAVCAAAAGAP